MKRITVAKGDGIGPEIMDATLSIIKAAGAKIEIDEIEVGEKVYLAGNTSGISKDSWDIIRRNKIFLKAPITTPQGGGYKSLNVTTRKFLGLYANIRPCISSTLSILILSGNTLTNEKSTSFFSRLCNTCDLLVTSKYNSIPSCCFKKSAIK